MAARDPGTPPPFAPLPAGGGVAAAAELLDEFVTEAREQLDAIDQALLGVEREGSSPAAVAAIFRPLHSLKGGAVALGFERLAALAHAGEELLVRRHGAGLDAGAVGALIAWLEAAHATVERVAAQGADDGLDPLAASELMDLGAPPPAGAGADDPAPEGDAPPRQGVGAPLGREELLRALRSSGRVPDSGSVRVSRRLLVEEERLVAALDEEVGRLRAACLGHPALGDAVDRIGLIAAALDVVMRRTRIQPIGALFLGAPRIVRDLARVAGKQVRVAAHGGDLELPRTLLETVQAPLAHLLRNAVAHGVEPAAERVAAGKAPVGLITLGAGRDPEGAWITVADDGRGLDLEGVRRVAVARGLAPAGGAAALDQAAAAALIVLPGFTTAERVSHLAGRGMGLDVVKVETEQAGGRVEIESTAGRGTVVRLRFPAA